MNSAALKMKTGKSTLEKKRLSLNQKFGNPTEVLNMMADYIKDGDIASITDLISAYVANSSKYKNQDQFAEAIGTTRQTLHRMFSHEDTVSLKIFFGAIEQIHNDSQR